MKVERDEIKEKLSDFFLDKYCFYFPHENEADILESICYFTISAKNEAEIEKRLLREMDEQLIYDVDRWEIIKFYFDVNDKEINYSTAEEFLFSDLLSFCEGYYNEVKGE